MKFSRKTKSLIIFSSFLCATIFLVASFTDTLPKALEQAASTQSCNGTDKIYVISHGWHVGLGIKAEDLNSLLPGLVARFPDSQYYEIGWGDSGFYKANEITAGLALRAMFMSAGSIIHVVGFNEDPEMHFMNSDVKILASDSENYQNLLQFIKSSFQTSSSDQIIKDSLGIYGNSQFYTGIGTYQMFNTCNKWTAKALYSAGYNVDPMFKLTSSSVMNSIANACN